MRRRPKSISAASLERAALFYLQRFATSTENLRRVLSRKVDRVSRLTGDDPAEAAALIGPVIERLTALGLLDDTVYAQQKASALARRGLPRRRIRAELRRRGLATDDIDRAMQVLGETEEHTDLRAAVRFAERRRIGPYRLRGTDERTRARELGMLARAGFSYAVARAVVDAVSVEALISAIAPDL